MQTRYIVAALVLFIGLGASVAFYVSTRDDIPALGKDVCLDYEGLPGAATGKLFHRVGRDQLGTDELAPYDAEVYDEGDWIFEGYCGPDNEWVPGGD